MSLLGLFEIGRSFMFASQTALLTTSHNIANARTPGFSRQEVILQDAMPVVGIGGLMGAGVTVSGIKRHYDRFIQLQLIGQQQNLGRSSAMNRFLSPVEEAFNEAKEMGLSKSLNDYFCAWNEVAANPEGLTQRSLLLQKANGLVTMAKRMEKTIKDDLGQINESMDDSVNRINSLTKDIAQLNDKIVQIEVGQDGENANDLRDQRDSLMNELSNLIEINSYENSDGSITVTSASGTLVTGVRASTLSTQMNQEGNKDLYLNGINITSQITKGQLGGLIDARADIESGPLLGLRRLVASITMEVNQLHTSGYALDGSTGNNFFNPLQVSVHSSSQDATATAAIKNPGLVTLDEYTITFDGSGNYSVRSKGSGTLVASGSYSPGNPITFEGLEVVITGTLTSNDAFTISPLTDAIENFGVALTDPKKVAAASSQATVPGDNTNALKIFALQQSPLDALGKSTFKGFYNNLVSNVGTMSRDISDTLKFDQTLLAEMENRRQSISGVSLDEEAADLIKFQRAFEAGAKMIKVTDELLQTVLDL